MVTPCTGRVFSLITATLPPILSSKDRAMSVNAISTPQRGLVTAGHVMVVAVLLAVVGCATQRPWIPPETFAHPTFLTLDPSWTAPSVHPVL